MKISAPAAEKIAARHFLQDRLTADQVWILCCCLKYNVPVAVYGYGLGKSTLVARLRKADFQKVYAPEDCSAACSAMSVPDVLGAVALHVDKEKSPGDDALGDSFTDQALYAVIEDASEHIR
ncbi:MAG: hypothetical protein IJ773_03940 [Lachnospiraceae bacterium]|nr:hypothetical protein [Acidaminococcaceae bacterium]MBQ9284654.1 hypothetical protein [Acidaminococcaceae bacterium]MBR1812953.1 hypothetical protein [Lachnospiraceae bacterium]